MPDLRRICYISIWYAITASTEHPRDGDLLRLAGSGEVGRFVTEVRAGERRLFVCQRTSAPVCERMEAEAGEWERAEP